MTIEINEDIRLDELSRQHKGFISALRADLLEQERVFLGRDFILASSIQSFIEKYKNLTDKESWKCFVIFYEEIPVGMFNIYFISEQYGQTISRAASLEYVIIRSMRRKGMMKHILNEARKIVDRVDSVKEPNTLIVSKIDKDNEISRNLALVSGFKFVWHQLNDENTLVYLKKELTG
ncbi:MAG TPA: GNAT family protein [Candidatus Paceibacterota bacterium]